MSASADVLAQAKVEVALDAIPEGKNVRFHHFSLFSSNARNSLRFYDKILLLRFNAQICSNIANNHDNTGRHQVAWKASLHSPPHRFRDPRSRVH